MSEEAFLTDKEEIKDFTLASTGKRGSNTLFTITSMKTGKHFTFRVKRKDADTPMWFVGYLSGPRNTSDYRYLGIIKAFDSQPPRFTTTAKSPSGEAPTVKAFRWFFNDLLMGPSAIPQGLTFNHHGHCCACGRLLTVPESVASGWGPVCAERRAS